MELQPHQQRVVTEKTELDEKISALLKFFDSPIFTGLPVEEMDRLLEQYKLMAGYSEILRRRIQAFTA